MGIRIRLPWILLPLVVALVILTPGDRIRPAESAIIRVYVDKTATGDNDGTSWEDAFTNLQSALTAGAKQVWVADGVYLPATNATRTATFTVLKDIQLYGGFAGGEFLLKQRNIAANPAVLSGNLGPSGVPDGSIANNAYRVVTIAADAGPATILDGFTVREGNEDRTGADKTTGGILNQGGVPKLSGLTVTANLGKDGAGLFSSGGDLALSGVTFRNNIVGSQSKDVVIVSGDVTITNCTFEITSDINAGYSLEVRGGSTAVSGTEFTGTGSGTNGVFAREASLRVDGSTFTGLGNGIDAAGGQSVTISESVFVGNRFGVSAFDTTVELTDSRFSGHTNTAVAVGDATVERVLFEDNETALEVSRFHNGDVTLVNSTITGSTGNIAIDAQGGTLLMEHVTIADNPAPTTVAAGDFVHLGDAAVTIRNSILWDNAGDLAIKTDGSTLGIEHSAVEGGCPAVEDISCANIVVENPQIGALADNGGPTRTIAIAPTGSATDSANPDACPAVDQRGLPRPVDGNGDGTSACDLGAFELDTLLVGFAQVASSAPEAVGTASVTVSLNKSPASQVTVDFAVTGGTAGRPGDYTLVDGSLVFPAGVTSKLITLSIVSDATLDPNETVQLTLSNPVGAPLGAKSVHTLTITEGAAPAVQFAALSAAATEGPRNVSVAVSLSKPATGAVTVKYAVTGGSAKQPADYTLASGTLSFAPNDTGESIGLALKDDLLVEPNETVIVTLSAPTNAVLGAKKAFTLTIKDNEPHLNCNGKPATMVGGPGADVLNGTPGVDVIVARGGNDTIDGKGAGDTICAGRGNDIAKGGNGNDTVLGESGNDTIDGGSGNDGLRGGGGIDVMHGRGGNDTLRGEGNPDQLFGEGGRDSFHGGPGKPDRCNGGPGVDSLLAGHACEAVVGVP